MADTISYPSSGNVNIGTYYFKHESEEEVILNVNDEESISEGYSDSDNSISKLSLHYSKEDIRALAVKAEEMVLNNTVCENYINNSQATWQANNEDESSDSDYESKISRDCFISSEPNISQRRLSPKRKLLNSRRRDWRNSLPACMEYFSPSSQNYKPDLSHSPLPEPLPRPSSTDEVTSRHGTDSPGTISQSGGRISQASVPLSDLWEQEQYLSESPYAECRDDNYLRSILNFGEDYEKFLTESSDSDFSERESCLVKYSQSRLRSRSRLKRDTSAQICGETDFKLENSKYTLEKLLKQIKGKENMFGSCEEYENILQICQENLTILYERRTQEKTYVQKSYQKSIERLSKHWKIFEDEVLEMLHQCLEFGNIVSSIESVKDDLMNLSELAELNDNMILDAETGLDKCKYYLSRLVHLSEDLFQLNLSVHDLLCQVSMAGHRQNISLVYQCKQEVIILYRDWEDAHKKVTKADRKYLKLSYVEAAHKCISDVLTYDDSGDEEIRLAWGNSSDGSRNTENLVLEEKLARLQRLLNDLKNKIVTNDTPTKIVTAAVTANPTKDTPVVTAATNPPSRWTHLLPKLSFISTLVIISVVSVSFWSFPQCCDYQSSWQIWPQFGYSNGPQPV